MATTLFLLALEINNERMPVATKAKPTPDHGASNLNPGNRSAELGATMVTSTSPPVLFNNPAASGVKETLDG
jgi:hypothetical protein